MFQTTRRRLALWYTTVTAVLLFVFASGFYFYVRSTLIERIDDTLNHVAEVVQRSLVIEAKGDQVSVNVEASFRDNSISLEDDHIDLEWFDSNGNQLWSTFAEPPSVPLHLNQAGETVHASKTQLLRQVTERVQIGRRVLGYLRVSHPWFEVTKPTRQLVLDLSIGTATMIGIVAAIGWFLSGIAMQPIRESYQRLKQFTADASHELRNPIAIIQTNVQVALSDPNPEPQTQQQHLQVIERLTRRLGKLVDDLLFLARQDSGIVQPQRSAIELDELLDEVLEEQGMTAAEKEISLSFKVDRSLEYWLQGDRDQLSRLFTNLISNAIKYTPEHREITVELAQAKSGLQTKVIDTGIGIPEDAIANLFDRFYRVDPARTKSTGGSGLGLAIAQAIVENHSGQIQIESQINQGTTAIVTLPQSQVELA
ncbi:MAG: sensor histidine kinase [Plectolyngbya sp. WJT66-NPBG17]|jgi:OmpR-family two-component system manganese-sensing sensor histidine kinase|nr:sensor histidine kinase [Plectolyngbya sp. WJT66-NPBG17]MBW4526165.1 sensor histidine kinase [Phormidium tanganyikae FI6-MK23]